jgi:hypothetical protein
VTVQVGSLVQTASFASGSDTATLNFNLDSDASVQAAAVGQLVNLSVSATCALPAGSNCTANALTQSLAYTKVASAAAVPTLQHGAILVLVALLSAVAVYGVRSPRGRKLMAWWMMALGAGWVASQPGRPLHAATGDALQIMGVIVNGNVATVTVQRKGDCDKVNSPPVLPAPPTITLTFGGLSNTGAAVLPAATDADNDGLTYSVTGLPSGYSFDATTRTLSWSLGVQLFPTTYTYTVTDGINAAVSQQGSIAVQCPPGVVYDQEGGTCV